MTDAFKPSYIKSRLPVNKKILSEGTCQKDNLKTVFSLHPSYVLQLHILSLNLKKEERKE